MAEKTTIQAKNRLNTPIFVREKITQNDKKLVKKYLQYLHPWSHHHTCAQGGGVFFTPPPSSAAEKRKKRKI